MPICKRCGQGFEAEERSCPKCGLPQGAPWASSGGCFTWLCLTVGQVVAALLCGATVVGTVLSLVQFRSSLPLMRALGIEPQGLWLVLEVLLEGCVGFCFWAGVFTVFTRTKRMPRE
jgi:hypothetical protein